MIDPQKLKLGVGRVGFLLCLDLDNLFLLLKWSRLLRLGCGGCGCWSRAAGWFAPRHSTKHCFPIQFLETMQTADTSNLFQSDQQHAR